jgi:hypothetical protein
VLDEERRVGVAGGLLEELDRAAEGKAGALGVRRGGEVVGGRKDEERACDRVVVGRAARLELGVGSRLAEPAFLDGCDEGRG